MEFTNLKSKSQNRKEDVCLAFSVFSSHIEFNMPFMSCQFTGSYRRHQVFHNFRVIKHGSTVQWCHFLYITWCKTLHLLGRLHAEHQLHYINCPLCTCKMDRCREVMLLGGDLSPWCQTQLHCLRPNKKQFFFMRQPHLCLQFSVNNISHSEVCQITCIRIGDFKDQSNISLLHIPSYEGNELNLFLYMPWGQIQGIKV